MIEAKNDEGHSPESAKALWESIGREPDLVWLDAGHYNGDPLSAQELVRLDRFFQWKVRDVPSVE